MTTETDEDLALEYLGCKVTERDGVIKFAYVKPGSDRERSCVRAISRLLRSTHIPMSHGLRWRLASLFDPDATVEARRLELRPRRRGKNQPSDIKNVEIARLIAAHVNSNHKLESAVAAAMTRYQVSRATAMRAWRDHGAVWITKGSIN